MKTIRWRLLAIALLALGSLFLLVPRKVAQKQYDRATGTMRDTTVRRVPINLGLDLRGGIHLALEVDESKGRVPDCAAAIRQAERVVRTRMDEFGTSERVVQVVGDCRLIVELPGISDPERARAIVQRTAFLEFRITDDKNRLGGALPAMDAAARHAGGLPALQETAGPPSAMTELFGQDRVQPADTVGAGPLSGRIEPGQLPGEFLVEEHDVPAVETLLAIPEVQRRIPRGIDVKWGAQLVRSGNTSYRPLYALEARSIITGADLQAADAGRDPDTNRAEVRFTLTRAAGRKFGDATGRNVGNHLAILLDGRVQGQPPVIQERIEATGRIALGDRTLDEAADLALVLRAGALPVPLHIVEERTIGPTLGSDSIVAGVRAAVLAIALVVLVMGVYYKRAGMLAVGAMFLFVLFSLAGLAVFGSALTLPGLAGFALSIGMAVDANVLIFERIREELARSKTVRQAVDAGFQNAKSAIVDSNVTTALTAIILYLVGTGPVRGFAITLLIGLVASMLTAIFVTRTFFMIWLQRRPKLETLRFRTIQLFANAKFDFIAVRRWAYGVTALVILPGMLFIALRGLTYSIEFTGGALVHMRTASAVGTAGVRVALERGGFAGAEIQSFGSDREFAVRARLTEDRARLETAQITAAVRAALDRGLGAGQYEIVRTEAVGPKVGAELQQKALIAILFSFVTTLIYLAFRFEWRFGLAAVIATAHDILATIALMRYLDLEVSLVVVAAVLTVLGYSLNDTIVIFDRVRENLRTSGRRGLAEVLNASINETLPRTVLTGGITLATALVLAFFAGEMIKPFALVMSFGILVGTFSSIFVAAPVLLWIEERWPRSGTGVVPR